VAQQALSVPKEDRVYSYEETTMSEELTSMIRRLFQAFNRNEDAGVLTRIFTTAVGHLGELHITDPEAALAAMLGDKAVVSIGDRLFKAKYTGTATGRTSKPETRIRRVAERLGLTTAELAWHLGMTMIQPKYISDYVSPLVEEIARLHKSQRRDVFFNLVRFARIYRYKFPSPSDTRRWTMTLPQDLQRARNLAVHYAQQLPGFVRFTTVVETLPTGDIFDKLDLKLPDEAGTVLAVISPPTPLSSPHFEQQERIETGKQQERIEDGKQQERIENSKQEERIETSKQPTNASGMIEVDMVEVAAVYPWLRVTTDEWKQWEKFLSQRQIT
jgi:hypothetical protein